MPPPSAKKKIIILHSAKIKKLELNDWVIKTEILFLISENRLNNFITKIPQVKKISKKRKVQILNSYINYWRENNRAIAST